MFNISLNSRSYGYPAIHFRALVTYSLSASHMIDVWRKNRTRFLFVLHIKPVFNKMLGCLSIEQIPLFNILKKFDGEMVTEVVRPQLARMRYEITRLPHYIILHMRRFTKNNFFVEKNPTLGEHSCCGLQSADMLIVDCLISLVFCMFCSVYTTPHL